MKIGKYFSTVSALLLVAGCAHHNEREARYSDFNYGGSSSTATYQQPGSASSSTSTSASTTQSSSDTDTTLVSQVQQTLRQDNTVAALMPGIQISAQNGSVTLSGNVSSEQEKQRIESMVKNTSGVVTVNNQLQVSVSPTSDRPGQGGRLYQESPSSTAKPESSSPTAPDLSKSDTSTPETTPTTSEQASQTSPTTASATAAPSPTSTPGASARIYSQTDATASSDSASLNVQGLTEADRTLGQKIQQEMRADTSLAAQLSMIKLSVDSGKITLKGSVKSEDQKQSIEQAVQRVSGVTSVDNQLQVSGSATDAATTTPEK